MDEPADAAADPTKASALSVTEDGQIEKRPPVPPRVRQRIEQLWKDTNNVPDFNRAVTAWRECQKVMFPAWFDRTDPQRGMTPQEQNTRENDRRVRVNYCLKNVFTAVAMMVPDDHDFEWEPIPQIGEDTNKPDPVLTRFAETIKAETKSHLEEIRWQDIIEGYAQDSLSFRIACLKITYDTSFIGSPVSSSPEDRDSQANVQRLRVLVEDFTRRVFTDSDARFQEMMDLKDSLKVEGELETWAGIRAENIPLDCVRWSSVIRDIDRIHLSPWISHDVLMSGEDLRAKFPYKLKEDGTWEGIHPDDITSLLSGQNSTNKILGDTFWTTQEQAGTSAATTGQSEAQTRRYLVREVWNRADGVVETMVETLEYPAAKWSPTRTSSSWYPFRFFRFNRVQGTVYGISDVELQKDIQNRMNRKMSDGEKARWLSIPRHIYDTNGVDGQEVVKVKDINPGELRGMNLQGRDPKEVFMGFGFEYDPASFDITQDQQDMRQMASMPEQVQGVTGRANFATEVEGAMQGMAINSNARNAKFRRELGYTYHDIAGLLVQNLSPQQVKLDHGPNAFFPTVYSEAEGKQLYAQIQEQAKEELAMRQAAAQDQAAAVQGIAGAPPAPPTPDEADSALAALVAEKCQAAFGFPEPVTREVLFRRLRCKVTVAINAQADRAAQGQSILQLFQAIQAGGQAAQAAGRPFDPEPLLKMAGNPEWAQMFPKDPAQMLMGFVQLAQKGAGDVPPELAMQVFQILQPIVMQAQAAAMQQQQSSPAGGAQQPPSAQPGNG